MKKHLISAGALIMLASTAEAQSSLTLYGIMDAGINYVSNDNGKSNWTLTSGALQGNRWGLKGAEDLGGGYKAVFQLENGFSGTSGALAQNRMFARQAYVGLTSSRYGTITMGRQYESSVDYVQPVAGNNYIGFGHPMDNDNIIGTYRINNSIKYTSADYGGFKFGGLYGFSNTPSSDNGSGFASNRAWSLGGSYSSGPLYIGAAYVRLSSPGENATGAVSGDYINPSYLQSAGLTGSVNRQSILDAGIQYTIQSVKLGFVFSQSKFTTAGDNLRLNNYDVNVGYFFRPDILFAGTYCFTDGKLDSTGAQPKYHQVGLVADFFASKRTDIYLLGAYQHAAGDATTTTFAADWFGAGGSYAPDASSSKNQTVIRVGMRHKF